MRHLFCSYSPFHRIAGFLWEQQGTIGRSRRKPLRYQFLGHLHYQEGEGHGYGNGKNKIAHFFSLPSTFTNFAKYKNLRILWR